MTNNKKYKYLYDNYYLDNDNRNLILYKRVIAKPSGRIRYDRIGYYPRLSMLIDGIKENFKVNKLTEIEYDTLISKLKEIDNI